MSWFKLPRTVYWGPSKRKTMKCGRFVGILALNVTTMASGLELPLVPVGAVIEASSPFQVFDRNRRPWCGLKLEQRSRYRSNGVPLCFLRSSDPFDWAEENFLRFKKAWEFVGTTRGEGIVVGFADTGLVHHPEIIDNVIVDKSVNYWSRNNSPEKKLGGPTGGGHGVGTASLIVSPPGRQDYPLTPEQLEIYGADSVPYSEGVAPGAKLISYAVGPIFHTAFIQLARAIDQAIDDGVNIISMSLGGVSPAPWLHRAIKRADRAGIILVAAAGNYVPGKLTVIAPAYYEEVVATAASDSDGRPWKYSSRGPLVDITAPGAGVWTAKGRMREGQVVHEIERRRGTSYSTAYVAGGAALFLAYHGHDYLRRVYGTQNIGKLFKFMLKHHAYNQPPGWDTKNYGPGIFDVYKLVSAPLPSPSLFASRKPKISEIMALFPQLSYRRGENTLKRLFYMDSAPELEFALQKVGEELKACFTNGPKLAQTFLSLHRYQLTKSKGLTYRNNEAARRTQLRRRLRNLLRGLRPSELLLTELKLK